ncbi:hypothetical protein [Vreelandella alkaliphila]|uniref:BZIP domain-containing protein n=1 Tax=Vreelandella alkaliphila TaxID=272774 RepID=A0AAJ2VQK5_9GAMM|nr:hypothetical protein [Halomonas alkaliphila]MDX5979647.1 hypothetical protein [Halomonas alkaliphila]
MQHFMAGSADDEVFCDFRPSMITESAPRERSELEMDELIAEAAENTLRSEAMGAVLTWLDEGDWSFDALDSLLEGLASSTDEEELTDEEAEHYEALWETTEEALKSLGAEAGSISQLFEENDDAAQALGKHLSAKLDDITKSDDDLVSEFGVGGQLILESGKRVIRNGELRRIPRRRRRKRRMTSAQRAALKKARRKANTSAAKRSRAKSMRRRKQMGA